MKVTTGTIARTAVLAVSLLNVLLNAFGKNPLPFSDDEVYTAVSTVVAVVASLAAWWKNNSFTKAALNSTPINTALPAVSTPAAAGCVPVLWFYITLVLPAWTPLLGHRSAY